MRNFSSIVAVASLGALLFGTSYPTTVAQANTLPAVSHITYIAGGGFPGTLRYAQNSSGSWSVETAATDAHAGVRDRGGNSMTIGPDGTIHAVYFQYPSDSRYIRYATKSPGGSWTVTNIPTGMTSGPQGDLSLAVDQNGRAHVSFANFTSGPPDKGIYYATNQTGTWAVERVRDESHFYFYVGGPTSLTLDAGGIPYVTFISFDDPPWQERGLIQAKKVPGTWQLTVVDPSSNISSHDVGMDGQGFSHVAYTLQGGPLKYATNRSGVWSRETVSTTGTAFASLALDSFANPHIAFLEEEPGYGDRDRVMHATPDIAGTGPWTIQPVTSVLGNYHDISLDVDQQGKSYISFIGFVTGDPDWLVRHATNASGSWVVAPVNSEFAWTGPGTSIRVR